MKRLVSSTEGIFKLRVSSALGGAVKDTSHEEEYSATVRKTAPAVYEITTATPPVRG
jgi:hypothetical protein